LLLLRSSSAAFEVLLGILLSKGSWKWTPCAATRPGFDAVLSCIYHPFALTNGNPKKVNESAKQTFVAGPRLQKCRIHKRFRAVDCPMREHIWDSWLTKGPKSAEKLTLGIGGPGHRKWDSSIATAASAA
jgi:hypothetical protein